MRRGCALLYEQNRELIALEERMRQLAKQVCPRERVFLGKHSPMQHDDNCSKQYKTAAVTTAQLKEVFETRLVDLKDEVRGGSKNGLGSMSGRMCRAANRNTA